jgi:hypothetical protein
MAALAQPVGCSVAVSASTYQDLREFLADEGEDSAVAVERFVDEAIHERILNETRRLILAETAKLSEEELDALVDESLEWARAQR